MAGTSYTRQSTITDGDLITASIFNNEYNQILNAFAYATSSTTGHQHDGSAGQGGNIAKIGDQDFKNKVVISAANNRIEFYSEVSSSPVEQVRIQDGLITPVTDSDVDLGTTSVRFKDAFVDSVTITNNIVVGGTVDGRDVATDGTKLDGIEASATADQTNAEIRTAVEAATDSNVFTDADHTKLNAIEASATADQTDAQIRAAVEAATDSNVFTDADHTKLNAIEASATADQTDAEIRAAVEAATDSNVFTDADHTKLNAIEASADVTDTANVTAAGALMDSEVTNLAQVKAFDSSDYATAAQGTLAAAALPKSGGAMTGAITTNSTFDGVDIATRDGVLTTTTNTANAALPKSGGAMTGAITTNSTFDGVDIATRDGVLSSTTTTANAALPKAGGTMSGAIAMGTSKITGAGDPTAAQDVATKAYVDANSGGDGGGETLQQTLAIGNTVTTDTKIQFRDTGLYINSSADGQLDIVADTEIQIAATTVDLNGVLDVSGNIVVAGTVDGVDIATRDGVLSSTTTTAGAALPKAGGTMTGTLVLGDNVKATFGDEPNLEIYHTGTHSIIEDIGNGSLFIKGGPQLKLFNDSDSAILCQKDGAVTLYHNAIAKFATAATGVSVTGTTATDAITIAGAITENAVTLSGTSTTIDLSAATNFVHDLTGATTYTFSNPASTGNASSFTLKIIQDATARAITWPSSVDWAGGTAPTLSSANNAVDVFTFYTIDGGTTYYGFTAGQAMA
jgi:hypothetical protein